MTPPFNCTVQQSTPKSLYRLVSTRVQAKSPEKDNEEAGSEDCSDDNEEVSDEQEHLTQ